MSFVLLISGDKCMQSTYAILVHFNKDSPLAPSQNSILQVLISSIVEKPKYVNTYPQFRDLTGLMRLFPLVNFFVIPRSQNSGDFISFLFPLQNLRPGINIVSTYSFLFYRTFVA